VPGKQNLLGGSNEKELEKKDDEHEEIQEIAVSP